MIGSDGCEVFGLAPGVVTCSPNTDPDVMRVDCRL